jgi:flagellar hook-associated protein 1 FlgK
LDAQVHSGLESLSEIANFTVIKTNNTYSLFLGGQTPLVIGDQAFNVAADFSSPQTAIRDSQGNDITSEITGGKLGGQLQEKNTILPGYVDSLNTIAQTFADNVNGALAQGVDQNGNPPTTNLFSYDVTHGAAFTLAASNITPDQIAAALPAAPGGNGNAVAIAQMATQPAINGFTFTQAFGNLGQQVGQDVAGAQQQTTQQQNLVAQAQSQRAAVSGVSLDAEAAKLLQFQQSYQAIGKLVGVLDTLAQTVMNMVQ